MECLQWHKVYKFSEDEPQRPPVVALQAKWPTLPEVHDGSYFGALQTRLLEFDGKVKQIWQALPVSAIPQELVQTFDISW